MSPEEIFSYFILFFIFCVVMYFTTIRPIQKDHEKREREERYKQRDRELKLQKEEMERLQEKKKQEFLSLPLSAQYDILLPYIEDAIALNDLEYNGVYINTIIYHVQYVMLNNNNLPVGSDIIKNAIYEFERVNILEYCRGIKFRCIFSPNSYSQLAEEFDQKKELADKEAEEHKKRTSSMGIAAVDKMDGHQFEHYCADLLRKLNFSNVEVTKGSGDQGVDIIAVKDGVRYAIQCKCYSSALGNSPVQEVNAGKQLYGCHVAVVLTNQHFTSGAKTLATATGVLLWDREKLQEMIKQAGQSQN